MLSPRRGGRRSGHHRRDRHRRSEGAGCHPRRRRWRVSARVPCRSCCTLTTCGSRGRRTPPRTSGPRHQPGRRRHAVPTSPATALVSTPGNDDRKRPPDSFGCIAGRRGHWHGEWRSADGDGSRGRTLQLRDRRAMLEIVHDVAPGAPLAFATANLGMASFAANIRALRDAGAKVIVDDVFISASAMFQDAQAVNDVVALGVAYFSSAGNQARQGYDTTFVPGPCRRPTGAAAPRSSAAPPTVSAARRSRTSRSRMLHHGAAAGFAVLLGSAARDPDRRGRARPVRSDEQQHRLGRPGRDPAEFLARRERSAALLFVEQTVPTPGRFKYVLLQASNVTTNPGLNSGTIYGHPRRPARWRARRSCRCSGQDSW